MTAQTVGKCFIDGMIRQAYPPSLIISNRGSQFTSGVKKEISRKLDTEVRHATTKLAQTICILETTNASLKTSPKLSKGERKSM